MKFTADLHIHSKYSRATSKENNILSLYKSAKIKGVNLLATGDFTHPGWMKEIEEHLVEDGRGFLDLKNEYKESIDDELPNLKDKLMKFIFSVEISSIYKKKNKVRKIHNLILFPDYKSVKSLNEKLGRIGNIRSDGRPILGMDSKNLLEMVLEINPHAVFIPAHIWTPWFSLFGMESGFDNIEDCFEDLSKEIFALETGLSSDPAMNWRVSALDRFNLVSNSDAHSPDNLARESNLFDTDLNYYALRDALKNKQSKEFLGTIEFFPEEGKYHYDGHRNCRARLTPSESIENNLRCPVCGKKVTVGVLHRVEELADRKPGTVPKDAKEFENVIPLKEIIGDAFGVGKNTNKVQKVYDRLIFNLGDELSILLNISTEDIKKYSTEIIAEGIKRVRENKIEILPGYDGEYGKIGIFSETDRLQNVSQSLLIPQGKKNKKKNSLPEPDENSARLKKEDMVFNPDMLESSETSFEPNPEQQEAVLEMNGPVIVIAGPGTGKTYTLVQKIIYLVKDKDFPAQNILGITFTNKAAGEIHERLVNKNIGNVNVFTFHSLALNILKDNNFTRQIFDENDSYSILNEVIKELNIKLNVKNTFNHISRIKSSLAGIDRETEEIKRVYEIYQARINHYKGMDYEDIIIYAYKLLKKYPEILNKYRNKYKYILADEFQDVNFSEYSLVKLLTEDGKSLFVIGDPDQSIYKFRGSDPDLIFKLLEDYPLAKKIILRKNYRNPDHIIKAGIDVIMSDSKMMKKYEDADIMIKSDVKVDIMGVPSQLSAGIQIAKTITNYIGGSTMNDGDLLGPGKRFTFKDFAILVRMASQIPDLEKTLLYEGIPYKIIGGKSFLDESTTRLGINILRLKTEEFNNFRFFKIIESDHFGIPDKTVKDLKKKLLTSPNMNMLRELDKIGRSANRKNLAMLKTFLKSKFNENSSPDKFFSEYDYTFSSDKNFTLLINMARHFSTVKDFLRTIILGREQDIELERENLNKFKEIESISILTLHSAKGLEFPVVFIYEPVEGVIPYLDGAEDDIQEERRLFYVGITRARTKLLLVIPEKRKKYGRIIISEPSRFIDDIKEDWVDYNEIRFDSKIDKNRDQLTLF